LFYLWGLLLSTLPSKVEEYNSFDSASLTLFFFWILFQSFENFAKKDKVPRMVPSIAQVVFITSPNAFERAPTSYSMAYMWSFG
jgi:hypothetical protein